MPTLLSGQRLGNLITYSYCCHEFDGVFAEFGVAKGGSLELLAKMYPERKIIGIDSFKGLPAPMDFEWHKEGDFALSDDEFNQMRLRFQYEMPNVTLLKGFSPGVFGLIADLTFAFVHIDVDMYSSVSEAIDFFYPRLVNGGMLLFDDYGFDTTPGAKKAIDEWKCKCHYRGELTLSDGRFTGQYLVIK